MRFRRFGLAFALAGSLLSLSLSLSTARGGEALLIAMTAADIPTTTCMHNNG
ncbi:MAG: hypothetical protein QOG58_79 [Caballeronia sp.]|jgi:hypothetical protein|nr:hypothetical protein [Caballeronia sp.]